MKTGDIVLIPFPFAELTQIKVRPAVVVAITKDAYQDIVICAVSSVIPKKLSENEFIVTPGVENALKVSSVVKVDRIVTLKRYDVIHRLGNLNTSELSILKEKFKSLVD